jgi:hypothetical protein
VLEAALSGERSERAVGLSAASDDETGVSGDAEVALAAATATGRGAGALGSPEFSATFSGVCEDDASDAAATEAPPSGGSGWDRVA